MLFRTGWCVSQTVETRTAILEKSEDIEQLENLVRAARLPQLVAHKTTAMESIRRACIQFLSTWTYSFWLGKFNYKYTVVFLQTCSNYCFRFFHFFDEVKKLNRILNMYQIIIFQLIGPWIHLEFLESDVPFSKTYKSLWMLLFYFAKLKSRQ